MIEYAVAQAKTPPDCAVCFRPHGDCRSDFIRRVQAAGRDPTWCDRGSVMPGSLKHRQRMAWHFERLGWPAKQGTASCPPDDAVEGGEAGWQGAERPARSTDGASNAS